MGLQGTSQGQPGGGGKWPASAHTGSWEWRKSFPDRTRGAGVCFPEATLKALSLTGAQKTLQKPGNGASKFPETLCSGLWFPMRRHLQPPLHSGPHLPNACGRTGTGCGTGLKWGRTGACHMSGIMGVSHPGVHPGMGPSVTSLPQIHSPRPRGTHSWQQPCLWLLPHPRLTHASMRPDLGSGIPPPSQGELTPSLSGVSTQPHAGVSPLQKAPWLLSLASCTFPASTCIPLSPGEPSRGP